MSTCSRDRKEGIEGEKRRGVIEKRGGWSRGVKRKGNHRGEK
jgi:hypothetical protein